MFTRSENAMFTTTKTTPKKTTTKKTTTPETTTRTPTKTTQSVYAMFTVTASLPHMSAEMKRPVKPNTKQENQLLTEHITITCEKQ